METPPMDVRRAWNFGYDCALTGRDVNPYDVERMPKHYEEWEAGFKAALSYDPPPTISEMIAASEKWREEIEHRARLAGLR